MKKFMIVISTVTIILVISIVAFNVYKTYTVMEHNKKELDSIKINNAFEKASVDGKLTITNVDMTSVEYPLLLENELVFVPTPANVSVYYSYDTNVYDESTGSFYCLLTKNRDTSVKEVLDKVTIKSYVYGSNMPVLLKVYIPNFDSLLMILCYTDESLSFFSNYNWDGLKYEVVDKESIESIPEELRTPMNEVYTSFSTRRRYDKLFYTNKTKAELLEVCTYNIGVLEDVILAEYRKLVLMGYNVTSVSRQGEIYFIKFDDNIVVFKQHSRNAFYIHYMKYIYND